MVIKLSGTTTEYYPFEDTARLLANLKVARYFLLNIKRSNDYILPLTFSIHRV